MKCRDPVGKSTFAQYYQIDTFFFMYLRAGADTRQKNAIVHWHRTFALFCLVLLAGVITGCGTSDTQPKSNAELLKGALFKAADLPKGWSTQPLVYDKECDRDPTAAAVATSASHLGEEYTDIQQKVMVFRTEKAAEAAYGWLRSRRGKACFRRLGHEGVENYSGGRVLAPLRVLRRANSQSFFARRMVLTVGSVIGPTPVYLDDIKGKSGRGIITVKISAGFAQLPEWLYKKIVDMTEWRLRQMNEG